VRDSIINLSASREQLDLITQAASVLGKNRSDFMLEAACERAHSVLFGEVLFPLDAAKFDQFVAALDAPSPSTPELERLLTLNPPWD